VCINYWLSTSCRRCDKSDRFAGQFRRFGRLGDILPGCVLRSIVVSKAQSDWKSLGRLKTLSWLSQDQLQGLAQSLTLERVKRRDTIFFEGESSNRIYILLSGVAKLSFQNRDERVLVGLVGPGEIFGVSSLLPHATRPFRCDAFNDCIVGIARPETFVGLVLGVPLERFSRTLEVTVGRWWITLQRYTNFVGLSVRERLAGALLELAMKFGAEDSRGILLTLKVTHADLAELVGASRQRTTEQLNDFENERVILRDGRRLIIVPERLRELVESSQI
jgi:CRP/FNR family transcriptional regulator, cyclic AMP receptor protein